MLTRLTKTVNLFIASAVLLAAGLAIVALPTGNTVQAQGGSDYSTTWTATDLIVGRLKYPRYADNLSQCTDWSLTDYGDPVNSEVALGVAKWTVKGQISGSTKYKELWSVPAIPTAYSYTGDFVGGRCTNGRLSIRGNSSQTDWLSGYMVDSDLGYSAVEFRTAGVTENLTSIHNIDAGRVANIGKTTSCQYTNRCMFTTGPYAWTVFHEVDESRNGKYMNAGALIPLKWNVAGYICEPGDNRCD